jgi:hypothetical protein
VNRGVAFPRKLSVNITVATGAYKITSWSSLPAIEYTLAADPDDSKNEVKYDSNAITGYANGVTIDIDLSDEAALLTFFGTDGLENAGDKFIPSANGVSAATIVNSGAVGVEATLTDENAAAVGPALTGKLTLGITDTKAVYTFASGMITEIDATGAKDAAVDLSGVASAT